jgi:hypothetical protein
MEMKAYQLTRAKEKKIILNFDWEILNPCHVGRSRKRTKCKKKEISVSYFATKIYTMITSLCNYPFSCVCQRFFCRIKRNANFAVVVKHLNLSQRQCNVVLRSLAFQYVQLGAD